MRQMPEPGLQPALPNQIEIPIRLFLMLDLDLFTCYCTTGTPASRPDWPWALTDVVFNLSAMAPKIINFFIVQRFV
jgi:hypothetical protein